MGWFFNPFTSNLDYFKEYHEIATHNSDTVLDVGDLRKFHIMDVSGGDKTFTLPEITSDFVGAWISLMKSVANDLTIQSGGMDAILNSTNGGYIKNVDNAEVTDTHDFTYLCLIAVTLGQWAIGEGFGIWSTY